MDTDRAGEDSRESGDDERSSLWIEEWIDVSRSLEGIFVCELV